MSKEDQRRPTQQGLTRARHTHGPRGTREESSHPKGGKPTAGPANDLARNRQSGLVADWGTRALVGWHGTGGLR
jgi:hypothetical protein